MRYHDTGTRDPSQVLAAWFQEVLSEEVSELRIQSGYFSIQAVGLLLPTLARANSADLITKILIGSNESSTIKRHVEELMSLMGVPRPNAHLGIVSFGQGLFHPKTYHVRRVDGSQAAFVGSANLTREGLVLHVEAAISLDTRDGDDEGALLKIAGAIDGWFSETREGFTRIEDVETLDHLVADGVIVISAPPRSTRTGTGGAAVHETPSPRLTPLGKLPKVVSSLEVIDDYDDGNVDDESTSAVCLDAEAELLPATETRLTFGMILQNTDVGVGQTDTTHKTQRRSPEVFIPMKAIDLQPTFWGWYDKFTADKVWNAANATWRAKQLSKSVNPLRPYMKMDRPNVAIKMVGYNDPIIATIWHNPKKTDIRIRSEQIRSAGDVGDIMLVRQGLEGSGYDFEIKIIPVSSHQYDRYAARLVIPINNSKKKIGYF